MSNCSNCYNGCLEIVSDRCVKYTGIDIPELGIQTGDTLSSVESSIINFLVPVLNGVGVKPTIDDAIICTAVRKYLPTCTSCTGFTLNDILSAIIQAACDLQEQVDAIVADIIVINDKIDVIEANYNVKCLTIVTPSITPFSGTHAILQATIDTLCALALDLETNYVTYEELPTLIQAYLNSTSNGLYSSRMIPYAVVPYFGPIDTFFNSSGAGTGQWDRIFLCNGNNGTPDLRGRGLTGAINGVPGPTMNPAVDPAVSSANPNYSLYDNAGANQISLLEKQIPLHTHANVLNFNDPQHAHQVGGTLGVLGPWVSGGVTVQFENQDTANSKLAGTYITSPASTGITASITNVAGPIGGGLPHANIQPVTACYYIQYRPV